MASQAIVASATLITKRRIKYEDGAFVEIKVTLVPEPVRPAVHSYKYRAVYIVGGERREGARGT